jgi:Flp pilus assembly protein TadD
VLARLGRNDEAAAAFRKEIAGYPGNSQAYANLAILLATMGRPREEVRRILEEMVRARPGPRSAALVAEAGRFLDGMDSARAHFGGASTAPRCSGATSATDCENVHR